MDKKNKKKTVIKRKADEPGDSVKKKIMVNRKNEDKDKVETVGQVVEVSIVESGQQIVHTGQLVEGKPEDEGANFVQSYVEVSTQQVEEQPNTYQQYELSNNTSVEPQEYQVAIIKNPPTDTSDRTTETQVITNEEQLIATGTTGAVRWLTRRYDYVVRQLQLNYDAGVKLLHSQSGCIQCVYLTTPSMQNAFNAVPQFLCIETGIEFTSTIPAVGGTTSPRVKQNVTLFLAEDGYGKSVIVSAGISMLIGDDLTWLLDNFKSCNPAWRQVRCVVCDPTKCQQNIRTAFPNAHVTCSAWQGARACARLIAETRRDEVGVVVNQENIVNRAKAYALTLLKGEATPAQLQGVKRNIIGTGPGTLRLWESLTRPRGAVTKLDSWLEPENYTNILHKGLERLVTKFSSVTRDQTQPDEFVSLFFNVANQLEDERRIFAVNRLRETETLKQNPTDTITQYAHNLMSHQIKLAQKCPDDKAGRRNSSAAICKYGTSTQDCSCLFHKVFKLPCRHILMLISELNVKTYVPFEPRWTVQHCLFGCDTNNSTTTPNNTGGGTFIKQVVVEDNQQRQAIQQQPQQLHQDPPTPETLEGLGTEDESMMEEGQEEWLSEGVLTDDDFNTSRMLGEGDNKTKKKVIKVSKEKDEESTDDDDEFIYEGAKVEIFKVSTYAVIKKYRRKRAKPENMSNGTMKPEMMDEEVPSDEESHSENGSLYDELSSSESEDMEDWFKLDIRGERAPDYLPSLGPKARELLLEEKRRVASRVLSLRQSLAALTDSAKIQADQIRDATMTLAELDDMLKAT